MKLNRIWQQYRVVLIGMAILLTACGPSRRKIERRDNPVIGDSQTCLSNIDKQELNIIGGVSDLNRFPETLMLLISKGEQIEICTGSFISESILLTAGHCLKDGEVVRISSPLEPFATRSIKSEDFEIHPDYEEQFRDEVDTNGSVVTFKTIPFEKNYADIGIVKFKPKTVPKSLIAKISSEPAKAGQKVFLVGFGGSQQDGKGMGTKRFGQNQISEIDATYNHIIKIKGIRQATGLESESQSVSTAFGDSGGALYDENGHILGTASSSLFKSNEPENLHSIYSNLHAEKTRDFLRNFLPDLDEGLEASRPTQNQPAFSRDNSCADIDN